MQEKKGHVEYGWGVEFMSETWPSWNCWPSWLAGVVWSIKHCHKFCCASVPSELDVQLFGEYGKDVTNCIRLSSETLYLQIIWTHEDPSQHQMNRMCKSVTSLEHFPIFYLQLCRKYIYALQRAILITTTEEVQSVGFWGEACQHLRLRRKKKTNRRLAQAFALRPSLTQRGYFEGREVAEMEVSTKMAAFRNWRWTYCYELVKLLVDEIVIYMQHVPLEISKSILHSPYQHVWPLWLQGRPETCGVAPAAPKDPEGRDARSQSHGWFLILFLKKLDIFGWIRYVE